MHYTSPHELELLLARSGFETYAIYGGFSGRLFNEDADEMICVARNER